MTIITIREQARLRQEPVWLLWRPKFYCNYAYSSSSFFHRCVIQKERQEYYCCKQQPFMMQFLSHSENILGKVPFHTTFQEAQWASANCLLLLLRVLVPLLLNAVAEEMAICQLVGVQKWVLVCYGIQIFLLQTQDEFLLAKILSKCLLSITSVSSRIPIADCRWRSSEEEGDGKIAWILSWNSICWRMQRRAIMILVSLNH